MSDGSLRATAHLLLLYKDDEYTNSPWFGELTIFCLSWVPVTQSVGSQTLSVWLD